MATKRKTYHFRHGDIIDVEEYHDGNYGAPGENRSRRAKPTKEQMRKVNAMNKARRARQKLLEYFNDGDCFATWTYAPSRRPRDMTEAKADFRRAMKQVRKEFKKRGMELYWLRNIEQGTKGAWHIHLVIKETGDTAGILKDAWPHGSVYISGIRNNDKIYDEDFSKLANYITKDEHTEYRKKDGEAGKPRIREASYSSSRNMPLKEPCVDRLVRWKQEVKPKKGYYIAGCYEGINPVTGYPYRRYTMIRLQGGKETGKADKYGRRGHPPRGSG